MRRACGAALGALDARHLLGLGLELALLDLPLLEGQHVLHRLFLRLGGDDLLARGRLGGLLAAHFLGLAVELGLLDVLVLQLQRVAHLLGRQLLGQQALHAAPVVRRQVDLAHLHGAQHDAVLRPAWVSSSVSIACWISTRLVEKISRTV